MRRATSSNADVLVNIMVATRNCFDQNVEPGRIKVFREGLYDSLILAHDYVIYISCEDEKWCSCIL